MLRNLPIKQKGLIIVSAPLLLLVVLLATLYSIGASLDAALARTVHSQEVLVRIESAAAELSAIHGENLQLALLGNSESSFQLGERRDVVMAAAHELQTMTIDNEHQSRIVAEFVPLADELLKDLQETFQALQAGGDSRGAARAANDDRKLARALALCDELKVRERELAVERLEQTNRLGRNHRWALVAGGSLTLLIACTIGGWAMASMVRRLLLVRENVRRLALDDELLPPTGGRDEIAQIDLAVHEMVRSLRAQRSDNEMFIYSVSHDLRSPLVNLQGFGKELAAAARELRRVADDDGVAGEPRTRITQVLDQDVDVALHFIDLAVQRQSLIIDSLLSLSRAGRVEYAWQDVQLGPIVHGIVAGLRNQESMADVEFVVGDLPVVYGDPSALERVFDNLIGNAVKYRSPARPLRIEIGAESSQNGMVRLFVRDNGIGIESQHLKRVFLPFSRFAGGEGEGIGLSLVRRVVDRHHGRAWIESQPDVGSTVFVELRHAEGPPAG